MKKSANTSKEQKTSKKNLVKNWLLSGKTITHRECSKMYGADRLADIVYKLRREGMRIEGPLQYGQDRFLNEVRWSKYRWLGEIPRIVFNHTTTWHKTRIYDFFHKYPMSVAEIKRHIKEFLKKKKVAPGFVRYKKRGNAVTVVSGKKSFLFYIYNK